MLRETDYKLLVTPAYPPIGSCHNSILVEVHQVQLEMVSENSGDSRMSSVRELL